MIRCARVDQTGDLDAEVQVPLTTATRRALDQTAHELRMETGRPYSAADVVRHYIEQGLGEKS